jgi:hypothetical protein
VDVTGDSGSTIEWVMSMRTVENFG